MLLIGAKIQECRKMQSLNQEEFAARVGVTRQAVSKWETDKAYPDLDKLATICDILQISITELVYGEVVPELEEPAGQTPEIKEKTVGKARGKGGFLRLWILFALIGGMLLFCGVLLVTVMTHNSWTKEDVLTERVRVERVYRQYTKADVSFFDDVSRRVVKTVWLDVNGIREGDFLFCYTDEDQKGVYYEYQGSTLIVLTAAELVFFVMLFICIGELRRYARDNVRHIPTDEMKESEQP